ncbi:MAG TPA: cytochrome c/FTR1 family iron permease [Thermodesulfobacteriota bacterium]|nr:cytochrome c/FTR1 family iron permease [Thermodesulfobacteriota bacterium]
MSSKRSGIALKSANLITIFLFFLLISISTSTSLASEGAKRILSLVDYIGGDYKNAVQQGKIIHKEEYNEMLEFSSESLDLFKELKSSEGDKARIEKDLTELKRKIESKSPINDIESLSKDIKNKIISTYGIVTYPQNHPSLGTGRDLYVKNCAQCHGVAGAGNGSLAPDLNPPPTNFTDPGSTGGLSPFKVYNTMRYGIEGTAMSPFPNLSEDDKWNVSFYVLSLELNQNESKDGETVFNINKIPEKLKEPKILATLSNDELKEKVKPYVSDEEALVNALAYLRKGVIESKKTEKDPLAVTSATLKEAIQLYEGGDKEEAHKRALDAYLEGFEKVEPQLFSRDAEFGRNIEAKLAEIRGLIKDGRSPEEIKALHNEIENDLQRASVILTNGKPIGKALSFINSFAIIVREGLEAALIVAAVIAFLGATGARNAIRYVHLGWILALVAGLVTWVLAQTIIKISGAQREIIEGVTSLLAAAVLFYVSYWLITKIEVKKWKEYIQSKVKSALSKKSIFALASVSFFAVYREAFETVLFYQALWLQTENSQGSVIWGFLAGTVLIIGLVILIFKLGLRIPLKYFFSITTSLLYFLCFVLAGKGIREFQEAGVISITPLDFIPQIDVLGIYPTLETSIVQGSLLIALIGALLWLGFIKREREKREIAVSVSRIADDMKSMHEAFEHIKGHILEWRRCKDIDLEAEELDQQIKDVIRHVDDLEGKLEDFFDVISKNRETVNSPQTINKKPFTAN